MECLLRATVVPLREGAVRKLRCGKLIPLRILQDFLKTFSRSSQALLLPSSEHPTSPSRTALESPSIPRRKLFVEQETFHRSGNTCSTVSIFFESHGTMFPRNSSRNTIRCSWTQQSLHVIFTNENVLAARLVTSLLIENSHN